MTTEQVEDLKDFITKQLEAHGFSSIVEEASARVSQEVYNVENRLSSKKDNLIQFLQEVSNALNEYSNRDYDTIIKRFNKNLTDTQVEAIVVTSNNKENSSEDLRTLPDYIGIVRVIDDMIDKIQNDNGTENIDDDNRNQ